MKRISLKEPPNPQDSIYKGNMLAWQRDMWTWANETKGRLEQASRQNDIPLGIPFVVSSYTTNTELTGTSTGTDVANFVCTLVQAMLDRGMITQVTTASS